MSTGMRRHDAAGLGASLRRMLLPALLLLALVPRSAAQTNDATSPTTAPPINIGNFLSEQDLLDCYNALVESDENNDNRVDNEEYVEFSQLMNPTLPALDDVDSYEELPLAFKAAFLRTACLCSLPDFGGNETALSCCFGTAAHVRVTEDRLYLFAACSYNLAAADSVRSPSPAPSIAPTTSPPTAAPTPGATTVNPTVAPTTATPTVGPTLTATEPSTAPPTPSVTTGPTMTPSGPTRTEEPVTSAPTRTRPTPLLTRTYYGIRITNGTDYNNDTDFNQLYKQDLIRAMNLLVPDVLEETNGASGTGRQRRRRRLQEPGQRQLAVAFDFPSNIEAVNDMVCPEGTPETDTCENVTAVVTLMLSGTDASNPEAIRTQFNTALSTAIAQGELAAKLEETNPNSPVTILDDSVLGGDAASGIAVGGTVGIVVGVLAIVMLVAFFTFRKGDRDTTTEADKIPVKEMEPGAAVSIDGASSIADRDVYIEEGGTGTRSSLLGAKAPDYGRSDRREFEAMDMGEDVMAEPGMDDDHQTTASSEAGNSGWSSSAGLSSYNTGSLDDSMDAAMAAGTTLAAMGAMSALSRVVVEHQDDNETGASESDTDIAPELARSQLDSLIEAGDWAAVGATAALLAATSDSASLDSRSHVTARSERSRDTTRSGIDSARAAELDQLIDAGDWEGVVLAAAKFESAESGADTDADHISLDAGDSEAGMSSSRTGTNTAPSGDTSISDSVSHNARKEEIRKEVVDLVMRVVPEELENVDEMMKQFKGREDELLETLRTMQERFVAQKARQANQKTAKVEARRTVQHAAGIDAVRAAAGPLEGTLSPETSSADASGRSGDRSSIASVPSEERRSALESAIEAGDWEAVGQAAAMLSDADTGSANSTDISQLNEALSSVEHSQRSMRSEISESDTARAARIDALIGKSDWQGVVEATKKFVDDDKPLRSREEEEALAEAEAWMRIAEQTKEGATDAAASEAAEWAIQKSLSQLNEVQKQQEKRDHPGDDENEV